MTDFEISVSTICLLIFLGVLTYISNEDKD